VVATVPTSFDISGLGVEITASFEDNQAEFPIRVIAFGAAPCAELDRELKRCLNNPDNTEEPECSFNDIPDWGVTLAETIPFIRHRGGFLDALAYLLYHVNDGQMPFVCRCAYHVGRYDQCDCPYTLLKLEDGKYRLFLYNPEKERYRPVSVIGNRSIIDAKVVSYYPILPLKFNACNDDQEYVFKYSENENEIVIRDFSTKIKPNGITVVDVTLQE
jgi:hypothetical protein